MLDAVTIASELGVSAVEHAALLANSALVLRLLTIVTLVGRLVSLALIWSVTLDMVQELLLEILERQVLLLLFLLGFAKLRLFDLDFIDNVKSTAILSL